MQLAVLSRRALPALVLFAASCRTVAPPAATETAAQAMAAAAATSPDLTVALRPEITRAELEAHVRFLASDELAGRATGTPGAERAARYLAAVLARSGVSPAGDGGTFLQAVTLVRPRPVKLPEVTITDDKGETRALTAGADFQVRGESFEARDLQVVVVKSEADVPRAPDPRAALFVDASPPERQRWLEKAGVAVPGSFALLISPGAPRRLEPVTLETMRTEFRRRSAPAAAAPVQHAMRVHGPAVEDLRAGKIRRLTAVTRFQDEEVLTHNVVGRIRGRGTPDRPRLADEVVVFSAHYDHLGTVKGAGGNAPPGAVPGAAAAAGEKPDLVYNGADDDASGTAAVLELAGALAAGQPPARTLVFLLAAAEELGMLGTAEYLDRPAAPLPRTVLNLNFEMLGRPDEKVGGPGILWLTGYEFTDLGPALAKAGLADAIKADPRPENRFFIRSDNFPFVQKGVIGQTLSSYNMHTDYHRPSDEAQKLDYAHLEAGVRTALGASRLVADGTLTPRWTADWKEQQR